jgi:hypothetical protein
MHQSTPFPFSKELSQKRWRKNALGIIFSSAKWNILLEAAKEKALQRCPGLIPDTLEECKQEYDQYFPEHHSMTPPPPLHLGQAGELQSTTPLDGG